MTTAVLIHGFSGSPASWRRVGPLLNAPSWAPSVCGHGADGPVATFEAEVDRLAAAIRRAAPPPRVVAGYSLGGRLALGLLVRHPNLFCGAALIGVNPGIDDLDRAGRRREDGRWARLIEEEGLPVFDRQWSALPLFGSQSRLDEDVLEEQRRIRLGHEPGALAAAMRTLSLGAMPDYRRRLPAVACPVELIVGRLDAKFRALARGMAKSLPEGSVSVVDGVGHNVPLEAPAELARLLNAALEGPAAGRCSVAGRRRPVE